MNKETIEKLCKELDLPKGDEFTQDWIYELPEEYRTLDSFKKYFQAYIFSSYDSAEKKLLFNLMMDITNDMIEMDVKKGNIAWLVVSYIWAKDKFRRNSSIGAMKMSQSTIVLQLLLG